MNGRDDGVWAELGLKPSVVLLRGVDDSGIAGQVTRGYERGDFFVFYLLYFVTFAACQM